MSAVSVYGAAEPVFSHDVYENDDYWTKATIVDINDEESCVHNFHDSNDEDWKRFYALKGYTYQIDVVYAETGCDLVLGLYESDTLLLLEEKDEKGWGGREVIEFTCTRDGIYYIRLAPYSPEVYGPDTGYELRVYQPVAPHFTGNITGRITDATSGYPLSGATIRTDGGGSAISHPNGVYYIFGHETGRYRLFASAKDYEDYWTDVEIRELETQTRNIALFPYEKLLFFSLEIETKGDGRVTGRETEIDCEDNCIYSFLDETALNLAAKAAPGFTFSYWEGDCPENKMDCRLVMYNDRYVRAVFEKKQFDLNLSFDGKGAVRIASVDEQYQQQYQTDTLLHFDAENEIRLTPAAEKGWRFVKWEGDCTGTNDCRIAFDSHKDVSAVFERNPLTLHLFIEGKGAIAVRPGEIVCENSCEVDFNPEEEAVIEAKPAPGWEFAGWRGGCAGGRDCRIRIKEDTSLTAFFKQKKETDIPTPSPEKEENEDGSAGCFIDSLRKTSL